MISSSRQDLSKHQYSVLLYTILSYQQLRNGNHNSTNDGDYWRNNKLLCGGGGLVFFLFFFFWTADPSLTLTKSIRGSRQFVHVCISLSQWSVIDAVSSLPLQTPPSTKSESADSFQPGSLFRQLVDQDEDTASPSLFKLSWLSGMTK